MLSLLVSTDEPIWLLPIQNLFFNNPLLANMKLEQTVS